MNIPQEIIDRYESRLINGSYIFATGSHLCYVYSLMLEKYNGNYLLWFNNGVVNPVTKKFHSFVDKTEQLFKGNKIVVKKMTDKHIFIVVDGATYKMNLA